jgi:hypothetical protein
LPSSTLAPSFWAKAFTLFKVMLFVLVGAPVAHPHNRPHLDAGVNRVFTR